ncbi:MAG: sterol desaturase family protein [Fuerstiella sp.]|nr:sterol desaturase family protein [Fuerstiella sp.]
MKVKSPDDALEDLQETPAGEIPRGAVFRLFGTAGRGGEYNGHIIFSCVILGLTAFGVLSIQTLCWVLACLIATFLLDDRSLHRKVSFRAIPGQLFLYLQLLLNAIQVALPQYTYTFVIYLGIYPLREKFNLPVSSFVMLYGFYMVIRIGYLLLFTWALTIGSNRISLRVFQERRANLRNNRVALRHVWWTYFLGNTGLFVKCAVQVMTIAGFESLRKWIGFDVTTHPLTASHQTMITVTGIILVIVGLGLSARLSSSVYYRTHRTFHVCKPLFDSVHAIHHRGILPTPLDSGTISPLEYIITDMARPAVMLIPNWLFVLSEIGLAFGAHLPSHTTGTLQKFGQHHLAHHKYVVYNFGLFPSDDERWGTRFVPEEPDATAAEDAGVREQMVCKTGLG